MASIRKRTWITSKGEKKCSYEITYYLDGKPCRVSGYKTKALAMADINTVTKTKTTNLTVKELARDYIDNHCKIRCKLSTLDTYENYYKVALKPLYLIKIKNLKKRDIERFILELKLTKANKTINNLLTFIKALLSYGVGLKIISENPASGLKPLPLEKKNIKAMSEELIELFIRKLKEQPSWVNIFFSIMLYTGIRISECIALEWADIDLKNRKISINKQYYRLRLQATKNYETRDIEIPEILVNILKEYKNSLDVIYIKVFTQNDKKYISVSNIRKSYFDKIITEMGEELKIDLSDITPHCLRHTHATFLLRNGVPLKYVSERLGHSDCKITLNIYNHVLQSDNDKAINLLNSLSEKNKQNEHNVSMKKFEQDITRRGVRAV